MDRLSKSLKYDGLFELYILALNDFFENIGKALYLNYFIAFNHIIAGTKILVVSLSKDYHIMLV